MKPLFLDLAKACLAQAPQTILTVLGPTASGKSRCAMALAQFLQRNGAPTEIVSLDSVLVYRHLDLGSAKPSVVERAQVAHHLIDLCAPSDSFSVADYCQHYQAAVAAIMARGHRVLLVGGTMMYHHALRYGLSELPPASARIRAELQARAANDGWPALHAQLQALDPKRAAQLNPHDGQRIERALEIYFQTQTLPSTLNQRSSDLPPLDISGHRHFTVVLMPHNRALLHATIEQRFLAMLAAGWLDEVRTLQQMPGVHPDLPAMRAVGYRQLCEYLTQCPDGATTDAAYQTMIQTGVAATRQLAKRQITWLRKVSADQLLGSEDLSDSLADALAA